MKYDIFLMDADDTLLDFSADATDALKATFEMHGVPYSEQIQETYEKHNRYCWDMFEQKKMTREELSYRRFELFFEEMGMQKDGRVIHRDFMQNLSKTGHMLPGATELLQKLRKLGRIYILTNGFAVSQNGRMVNSGIMDYASAMFISEEVGAQKPDKEYFDICFAAIDDFDPARAIMIGDSLMSDILGGINAGVDTCWYNPGKKTNAKNLPLTYDIATYRQLMDIITESENIGLDDLVNTLKEEELKCVAADEKGIVYASRQRGIAPMLALYDMVKAGKCAPTVLADRVFGRGAVMMAKLCGVKEIWAQVASGKAIDCANGFGITLNAETVVPRIQNRAGDGFCPIESAVEGIEDPEAAYRAILAKVATF